jgi:hypothetical protein
MGEAKKIERGAIRCWMVRSVCSVGTEVDEARLVGMEHQPVPLKTLAQDSQDPLGVVAMLERHDQVISVPDQGTSPLQAPPHLGLEPFIQPVVQVDVRKAR